MKFVYLILCLLIGQSVYAANHRFGYQIRDISFLSGFNFPSGSHPEQVFELCYERLHLTCVVKRRSERIYKAAGVSFISNSVSGYRGVGAQLTISPFYLRKGLRYILSPLLTVKGSYLSTGKMFVQPECGLYLRHSFYHRRLFFKLNANYGIRLMQHTREISHCPSVMAGFGWKI